MTDQLEPGAKTVVFSQEGLDDLGALTKRCAATGEQFSYDPETRQAQISALQPADELLLFVGRARLGQGGLSSSSARTTLSA